MQEAGDVFLLRIFVNEGCRKNSLNEGVMAGEEQQQVTSVGGGWGSQLHPPALDVAVGRSEWTDRR